ncbi:sigma-54-dependent Fis family transcriptional regulator, partial [bacterium]|nr:sigma-54-dependent Fis family transcriptional regulator [bacterium]
VTDHISTNTAIETMKLGAYDYITEPFDIPKILDIIKTAISSSKVTSKSVAINPAVMSDDIYDTDTIIGNSREMLEIYKMIGQVAQSDAPVLIQGESGTGKELIARAIYNHSLRKDRPFLAVNCAAIPEQLLESELFGHEKGSFTGAINKKIGKFEQCNRGTIFLDEIGDMSLSAQSKVLRVLQEQVFERVGGQESIRVDVRVIAATNKSLVQAVKEGSFRVDLFYRLKVISFYIPSLRERPEDIPLLADYFLLKYRHKLRKQINGISHQAIMILNHYHWPGNIRELENVIQSAIVLCKGDVILPEHLPIDDMAQSSKERVNDHACETDDFAAMFEEIINPFVDQIAKSNKEHWASELTEGMEKALLKLTLQRVNNNQVKASKLLGISRNTLRSKIEKFGL